MVQFGCHKGTNFLFLLQSFWPAIHVSPKREDVGFHIERNRTEPRRTKGLTGPETVTNILSQINAVNL
jgi:hypothetical protein